MRIYFDTEFTGLHQNTTLISIGLVDEKGREFYAEFMDYEKRQVNGWIEDNVIGNMFYRSKPMNWIDKTEDKCHMRGETHFIRKHLTSWFSKYDKCEMWSDCLAYDWVLFNSIFGNALDIPHNVHYIPLDLCTLMKIRGVDPDITREIILSEGKPPMPEYLAGKKHNALFDAYVIRMWHHLLEKPLVGQGD